MPNAQRAPDPAPLILTLALPEDAFAFFDDLRRRHFPPERNHLPAHVTLFHHLPGADEAELGVLLAQACAAQAPIAVEVRPPRFIGRGVVYDLDAPALGPLRGRIAARFRDRLTPQDAQAHRPHVTVQNKADPGAARALHASLLAGFAPFRFTARGLLLWRYRGGPWEALGRHSFEGSA